jgi:hypothetical protein
VGDKFVFEEHFGEDVTDITTPEMWIVPMSGEEAWKVTNVPDGVVPTYPIWVTDSLLVFVGYERTQP